jgi:iron(III) transport system permease protein
MAASAPTASSTPVSTGAGRRLPRPNLDLRVLIFVVVALFLAYEILVPLVIMVWSSVTQVPAGAPEFFSLSNLTLENYGRAIGSPAAASALRNTAIFAIGTTVVSFTLGGYLAWVVERTNAPWRRAITILCVVRLIIPGILTTVSWIFLASPRIGMLNYWATEWFGAPGPIVDVYSMAGMIFVQSMDVLPLAFLLLAPALRSMDPSLEEASLVAGRGVLGTSARITLPLMLPAILATMMLLFIRGIETFEVPALIGVPSRIFTFVVEIWLNTSTIPTDHALAATYAVFVLAFCATMVWAYNRITRHADMFATISGKAFRPRLVDLRAARWPTLMLAMVILFLSVVLPLIVLVWASFSPGYGGFEPISIEAASRLTLENYRAVWEYPIARRAFFNSSLLGVAAATIVVGLISVVAWITVKTRIPGRRLLDHLAFAPIAIPSVMLGVSFLWLYLIVPVPIYGTMWILLLLYVAHYTPVVMRIMSASMTQIDSELSEAAEVTGASWWRAFRTVSLPLLKPGLIAAWVFVMIHAFRELSASLLVYSPGNEPIGVAIFDLWENGNFGLVSALGVVALVTLIVVSVAAQQLGNRFGLREAASER